MADSGFAGGTASGGAARRMVVRPRRNQAWQVVIYRIHHFNDYAVSGNNGLELLCIECCRTFGYTLEHCFANDLLNIPGLHALRAAYRESVIDYDKALADRDAALIHAQRVIDDANTDTVNEDGDLKKLQIKLKQLEISQLYEAIASNGEVYAPCDGMITRVEAGIGSYTTSEAAIFINGTDSVHFVAQVSLEQKKYVNQGNLAAIALVGEKQARENLPITSIAPSKESSGFYTLIVELPGDSLVLGTSGTAQLKQSSGQTYETCVPLSALRNDGVNDYVLTVRETQTAMGTEYAASRVDVVLLERNESYAAIAGGLTGSSQIIMQANKAVSDGDRIRLAERK